MCVCVCVCVCVCMRVSTALDARAVNPIGCGFIKKYHNEYQHTRTHTTHTHTHTERERERSECIHLQVMAVRRVEIVSVICSIAFALVPQHSVERVAAPECRRQCGRETVHRCDRILCERSVGHHPFAVDETL